jgi:hypothetical protein
MRTKPSAVEPRSARQPLPDSDFQEPSMSLRIPTDTSPLSLALAATLAIAMTACSGPSSPDPAAKEPVASTEAPAAATPATPAEEDAAQNAATDLSAREDELAAREAELAEREAKLAEQETAVKTAAPAKTTAQTPPKTAAAPPAAAPIVAAEPAPKPTPPPPPPVTVAAGTPLSVKLNSDFSTKTTAVGTAVNAELASDLVVDGRRVAKAGAPISGSVTEATSGSKKIGAVPALKIDFTQLVVADGSTLPVKIRINQKGQSEKGRDTAKIAGGTAAGAIIGHQIDDGKGKVIGGLIGGAAGAIAAQKTGTEVELPAGTVVPANVRTAFVYDGR